MQFPGVTGDIQYLLTLRVQSSRGQSTTVVIWTHMRCDEHGVQYVSSLIYSVSSSVEVNDDDLVK